MKSIIGTLREWLSVCPYLDDFSGGQHIDWIGPTAGNYGIAPVGCSVIEETYDIQENCCLVKQYNAVLYARNWTVDDVVRLENADFLDNFQRWVEEQQHMGLTPKFGDNPDDEVISAENGMLFELAEDGQTGIYQIQLSVTYEKYYERKDA